MFITFFGQDFFLDILAIHIVIYIYFFIYEAILIEI